MSIKPATLSKLFVDSKNKENEELNDTIDSLLIAEEGGHKFYFGTTNASGYHLKLEDPDCDCEIKGAPNSSQWETRILYSARGQKGPPSTDIALHPVLAEAIDYVVQFIEVSLLGTPTDWNRALRDARITSG